MDKDILRLISFLVLLLIFNLVRWIFYKNTGFKQPKYMYWYLFILAIFCSGLVPVFYYS